MSELRQGHELPGLYKRVMALCASHEALRKQRDLAAEFLRVIHKPRNIDYHAKHCELCTFLREQGEANADAR